MWAPVGTSITFTSEFRENDVIRVRLEIVDAETKQRRVLTQGAGNSPTWSPDGGSIAFVVPRAGSSSGDLFRIPAAGGSAQHLASNVSSFPAPSWSPDGRSIMFVRFDGSVTYVVPAAGGAETRLRLGEDPVWSPDGRRIAFRQREGIFVMNSNGTGVVRVRAVTGAKLWMGPVWTSDGRSLLYTSERERNDWDLWVVNPDGSGLRPLTRTPLDERLPAWSPDRRRIAFVQGRHIIVMTSSGRKGRRLARGSAPTWSPTGREIAFSRGGFVYVVPSRGGRTRRIVKGAKPAWSPRGSKLVFVRGLRLIAKDFHTGAQQALAPFDCVDTPQGGDVRWVGVPDWSPDGRRLIIPIECDWGKAAYAYAQRMNADGSARAPLTPVIKTWRAAWSRDGQRIAFATGRGIDLTRVDGGDRKTVTFSAVSDQDVDW